MKPLTEVGLKYSHQQMSRIVKAYMSKAPDTQENIKCICETCPTFKQSGLSLGLFCAKGKVKEKVKKIECVCGNCPLFGKYNLKGSYFCMQIKPEAKRNLIGIYLLALVGALITITVITYFLRIESALLKSLVYVGISGGMGGVVYCIRGFCEHVTKKNFDLIWTWWYIFHPLTGIVIGVFAYFFIIGGLLSLGSMPTVDYSKNLIFYCAISFLAGFSLKQFVLKLQELAKTAFAVEKSASGTKTETDATKKDGDGAGASPKTGKG